MLRTDGILKVARDCFPAFDGPPGKKSARIVLLLEELNFGGTQRQALELALNLNPARFKAEIWTMAAGDDMEPLAEKGRIPVVHLSKKTWVGPECLFNLWRRLRSAPIDILVLMTVVPNIWGRLLGRLPESRSLSAPAEVTVLPSGSTKNCSGPWRTTISAMQSP